MNAVDFTKFPVNRLFPGEAKTSTGDLASQLSRVVLIPRLGYGYITYHPDGTEGTYTDPVRNVNVIERFLMRDRGF